MCTSCTMSSLVNHLLVRTFMLCWFTVLFNMSLFVVGLQMLKPKKGSSKVLNPLHIALTISQRTCRQVFRSIGGVWEEWRQASLSRVCIKLQDCQDCKCATSLQRNCLVLTWWESTNMLTRHTSREVDTFWSKVKGFGRIKLWMAVCIFVMAMSSLMQVKSCCT